MTACRYTSCVLADSPASFMSSIIRVRIADIVCSFVIDGTTRLDADDSLTSYSSGDAATPPRLRHRRSRPFNTVFSSDLCDLIVQYFPHRETYTGLTTARLATMLSRFEIQPEPRVKRR